MVPPPPTTRARLLAVLHGTESVAGLATARAIVGAVAAQRPDVEVQLCFLDVASPRLPDVLAAARAAGPIPSTVVVPVLLSTGYHVQSDIPQIVAGYDSVVVARHLGPHPLLVDAMLDRLPAGQPGAASTVLIGAGSSRSEARAELEATADLLGARTHTPVTVLTMADELRPALLALPRPVQIATYLLAEGRFTAAAWAAAEGVAVPGDPIGAHRALVELVWTRYDEACPTVR